MIGVVVVTHGALAKALIAAAEHVLGPLPQMRAVAIGPEDDIAARRAEILAAARAVDSGAGVVLLTDLFGGTPSNQALSVLSELRCDVIAGVNLPMLIKLGEMRGSVSLAEAAAAAADAGRRYIRVASEELTG
jgi:PTS system mannose-specific IIA component